MKRWLCLLSLLLVSTLAGCMGTLEGGIERTPTPRQESALGLLAYVQGGDIWVKDLRTSLDAEPVRLTTDGRNAEPRWSASGQWLAFRKGEHAVWLSRADGSAAQPVEQGTVSLFAWSPTADRLAYSAGQRDLTVRDLDAGETTTLIPGASPARPEWVQSFVWEPSGRAIACQIVQRAGPGEDSQPVRQTLRILRLGKDGADGADLVINTLPMGLDIRLAGWSGDGTHVFFWQGPASASLQADGMELKSIPVGGGEPVTLATGMLPYDDFVAPGPAADRLALVVGGGRQAWSQKALVLADAQGRVAVQASPADQAVASPAWSLDGQNVAYAALPVTAESESLAGGEEVQNILNERRVWVVNADGTDQRPLTNGPAYRDERPLWSADGSQILFVRVRDEQASLWLMRSDGSDAKQVVEELTPVPSLFGYYGHVDWDPTFDWWTGIATYVENPIELPAAPVDIASPGAEPTPELNGEALPPGVKLAYAADGIVYLLDQSGQQVVGFLPADVGRLVAGSKYLAYISGDALHTFSLSNGADRTLVDFGQRPGQDFSIAWSSDGSTVAYAVAWQEPDGSRKVDLSIADGYETQLVDTVVARPAGPTPTPPSMPPVEPEPGFANLAILGLNRTAGKLAVTQVGGQERYSAVWFYDVAAQKRVEEIPLPTDVQAIALSPDMTRVAVARKGTLEIWPLQTDAKPSTVAVPEGTHAAWLSWSPDSAMLAYLVNEGEALGFAVSPTKGLWVWEAANGKPRQLVHQPSPEASLHGWTPDSRTILLQALDAMDMRRSLILVGADTGQASPVALPETALVLGCAKAP